MEMKFLETIRQKTELTNYGLAKKLNELGVPITISGMDAYERKNSQSMRLDVLAGLVKLSGMAWNEVGKLIEMEFGTKNKKN